MGQASKCGKCSTCPLTISCSRRTYMQLLRAMNVASERLIWRAYMHVPGLSFMFKCLYVFGCWVEFHLCTKAYKHCVLRSSACNTTEHLQALAHTRTCTKTYIHMQRTCTHTPTHTHARVVFSMDAYMYKC